MEEDKRKVSWDDYHWLEERCEELKKSNTQMECQLQDLAEYIKNNNIADAMEYLVSEGLC